MKIMIQLIMLIGLLFGSMGCESIQQKLPQPGHVYSVDTEALQAVLPQTARDGFLPPTRLIEKTKRPVIKTYVLVKLIRLEKQSVVVEYTLKETELAIVSEHYQPHLFSKQIHEQAKLSRKQFDTLYPKLFWVAHDEPEP